MPVRLFRMDQEETQTDLEQRAKIERVRKNLWPATPEEKQQMQQEMDQKLEELNEKGRQALAQYEIIEQIHPVPVAEAEAEAAEEEPAGENTEDAAEA